MENIVLKDKELEKYKLSKISYKEPKGSKVLIQGNSKDDELEIEIKKCKEILNIEKNDGNSNVDDIFIERNELENKVKNLPELMICDSSGDSESFLAMSNCINRKSNISIQPTKVTSEKHKQIDYILNNSQYSPERKKIKLFSKELPFDSKLETSIQTSENFSNENIKNKLILLNGINLIPNKSLNEKTQSNCNFSDSVINMNKAITNFSNDYELIGVKHTGKTCINSEGENKSRRESCDTNHSGDTLILNYEGSDIDSEIERCNDLLNSENGCSLVNSNDNFQNCNCLNSNNNSENYDNVKTKGANLNNSNKNPSLKVNIQRGTDIIVDSTQLSNNESDIESEMEKCNQLLNISDVSIQIIESEDNSQNSDDLFYLESSENSQTSGENLFKLENNIKEIEDIKIIPVTNKYEENPEFENIIITLKNCQRETEQNKDSEKIVTLNKKSENITKENSINQNLVTFTNSENETKENSIIQALVSFNKISKNETKEISLIQNPPTLNKISDSETKENSKTQNIITSNKMHANSEIQNTVSSNILPENKTKEISEIQNNLNDKSYEEIKIDDKILFTNITPQKHRPERIFKLAMKSIHDISSEDSNSAPIIPNNSSDNNNNFLLSKLNDKEVSKDGTVKDYFEDEKDDITNPEWQAVKNLSTNEERYQQVRKCWKSRSVPDPNKNLTYHSYRKRLFCSDNGQKRSIKQHKRHASSSLPGRDAKRPCTFFLDREIDSIKRTKDIQKQEIINEMHNKIDSVEVGCFARESSSNRFYNRGNDFYRPSHHALDRISNRVTNITDEYRRIVSSCENSYRNKISALMERRNEVFKFYSFYRGLNDSYEDPTLLTDSQFQELDEIENIYEQFNHYYRETNN